jgi:DNA-binding Lrp family transcriptional regulator
MIPSKYYYFKKFRELSEADLEIIFAMAKDCPEGSRNIAKIAKKLSLPQQTVNYRVSRFDAKDLVRFRAIINERLIGLANFVVVTTVKPGLVYESKKEEAVNAGTFLTCHPVWRLLKEIQGGSTHGFFVLYAIPPEKEKDLESFLEELKKRGCITRVDHFCKVTQTLYNSPSLESYLTLMKAVVQERPVSFDWENWANSYDEAPEIVLSEVSSAEPQPVSFEDLLVLFHLEKNLREKFATIGKALGESSQKISRCYESILQRHLIVDCRFEIYPIDPVSSMHFTLKLEFINRHGLRKFASHLNSVPYPVMYHKLVQEEALFVHFMVPAYEYFDFHNAFEIMNRQQEIFQNIELYVSNFYSEFDNIKLYEAFSKQKNVWEVSLKILLDSLRRKLEGTKFKF